MTYSVNLLACFHRVVTDVAEEDVGHCENGPISAKTSVIRRKGEIVTRGPNLQNRYANLAAVQSDWWHTICQPHVREYWGSYQPSKSVYMHVKSTQYGKIRKHSRIDIHAED